MNRTNRELIEHIERMIFDVQVSDHEKVLCIQNLLYQREQILDHRTEQLFGDDDAHVNSPNCRRI